jgi:orotate phosphoribosyltransferase
MNINISDNNALRNALIQLFLDKSVKFGDFTLASGKKSDFFVDCKQSILSAEGHFVTGHLLINELIRHFPTVQAVAGVALGGCSLASAVSLLSLDEFNPGLGALYVRKERKDHGSTQLVEGMGSVPYGAKVVLLEDVCTTGGSSLKSIEILRSVGYEVLGVISLVDRLDGAQAIFDAAAVQYHSIMTKDDLRLRHNNGNIVNLFDTRDT